MNFEKIATGMSVDVYQRLKTAVELGRWPDGRVLTQEQQQISLEAILRYEFEHLPPEQRTGYMPPKIGSACDSKPSTSDYHETQTLRWQD